ncbi:hypothetical protein [Bifidobacterium simiarum]|uniref:hypothetical protein n=1 Tax=Bifidobacterium simiarum TaxID=2045441 RepID=UPI001BDDBFB8|nr:hypothetical protein [Bifidobacterium simiarum]MBT1167014.1 hypothetical protein [Bifidobacterium simiarum]
MAENAKCPICGNVVTQPATGRRRIYCSARCKRIAQQLRAAERALNSSRKVRRTVPAHRRSRGTGTEDAGIDAATFDDMMNGPVPHLEQSLRLVVRRLTAALDSQDTSTRDLAPLSRVLIDASARLESIRGHDDGMAEILATTDDTTGPEIV